MIPDISQIGDFAYSWDFDQNEYEEFIKDNNLKRNQETLLDFIKNYVSFDIDFYHKKSYHRIANDLLTLEEISEEFGDKLANIILTDCIEKGYGNCDATVLSDEQTFSENKKTGKTIIIDENKEQELIGNILNEVFYPTAEKVIYITDYLDKNFSRQMLDSLDDNGYPTKENTVVLLSNEKQPLKTLNMKEFLRLLDDKFEKMMSDKKDRRKFLKQVIKDWYFNKIKNGILTVNVIT